MPSEGALDGVHTSFYDLYRVEQQVEDQEKGNDGGTKMKIVEHWDTLEKVPPKTEWRNQAQVAPLQTMTNDELVAVVLAAKKHVSCCCCRSITLFCS